MGPAPAPMPAAFIGHGSPMNAPSPTGSPRPGALSAGRYRVRGRSWWSARTGTSTPPPSRPCRGHAPSTISTDSRANCSRSSTRPRATGVGRGGQRRGSPDLGRGRHRQLGNRPRHLVGADARIPRRIDSRGAARDQRQPAADYHLQLGAKLAPLRDRGVLVLGSGNIVHNLAGMDPAHPEEGFAWAKRFDDAAREQLASSPPTSAPWRRTPTTPRPSPPRSLHPAALLRRPRRCRIRVRGRARRPGHRVQLRIAVDGVLRAGLSRTNSPDPHGPAG